MKYEQLTMRTGSKNKAKVAIANHIARGIYVIISDGARFKERGSLDVTTKSRQIKNAIKRLKALGVEVNYHTEVRIDAVLKLTQSSA